MPITCDACKQKIGVDEKYYYNPTKALKVVCWPCREARAAKKGKAK